MLVEINTRGNGACPLCSSAGNCRIQDTLNSSLALFSQTGNPMELVVYSCPHFVEKSVHE